MKLILAFWIVISSCSQNDNSASSFQKDIPPKVEEPVEAESDSTYKLSSCESCLQLANRLSMHYFGWQASFGRAMNGKYKVAVDSDLCDIHFSLSSILNQQLLGCSQSMKEEIVSVTKVLSK